MATPDNGDTPRRHHESHVREVLAELRRHPLYKAEWEARHPGSRLAPNIDVLRNRMGFRILGCGRETPDEPYRMLDKNEERVEVTEAMREAYYASDHWREMRRQRLELDNYQCVACKTRDNLQVHHWVYRLFAEQIWDVETRCEDCHRRLHELRGIRLVFPTGVSREVALRLGWKPRLF